MEIEQKYPFWLIVWSVALGVFFGLTIYNISADLLEIAIVKTAFTKLMDEFQTPRVYITPKHITVPRRAQIQPPLVRPQSDTGMETIIHTCQFWRQQYVNDHTDYNEAEMNSACLRVQEGH